MPWWGFFKEKNTCLETSNKNRVWLKGKSKRPIIFKDKVLDQHLTRCIQELNQQLALLWSDGLIESLGLFGWKWRTNPLPRIHYVMSNKTERLLMNMKKPMFVRPSSARETFNGNSDLSRATIGHQIMFQLSSRAPKPKAQSGRQNYNDEDDRDTCLAWNYSETRS